MSVYYWGFLVTLPGFAGILFGSDFKGWKGALLMLGGLVMTFSVLWFVIFPMMIRHEIDYSVEGSTAGMRL